MYNMELKNQKEMQFEAYLGEMKTDPFDCNRFNRLAQAIYGDGKEGSLLIPKYLKKLYSRHKPHCKNAAPHPLIS